METPNKNLILEKGDLCFWEIVIFVFHTNFVTTMAEIVVVFDFDKTIVDCDSDNWVVDELGFSVLFNRLLPTMPWNTLMVSFSLHM